ncbi:hypothetical protein L7F22_027231 [Adiantum nelumboides]|nr:hypothetical protein [Adiantum nelumboides]
MTQNMQEEGMSSLRDSRWSRTREESNIPSEPSTPAASHFHLDSRETSRSRAASTSISQPAALNIDAEDEDVKIAIMALGAMKHLDGKSRSRSRSADGQANREGGAKHSSSSRSVSSTAISSPSSSTLTTDQMSTLASSSASTSSSTPATLADLPADFQFPAIVYDESGNEVRVEREDMADTDFLKRVSHLPIVRGTLRAYELGKQHSRVMRYGGGLVESSVKAISQPVIGRIGARLGDRRVEQLDDFACRQLDRIYPYAAESGLTKEEKQEIMAEIDEKDRTEWKDMSEEERSKRKKAYIALRSEESERARLLQDSASTQQAKDKNGESNSSNNGITSLLNRSVSYQQQQQQAQRGSFTAPDAQRQALIRAHSDQATSRMNGSSGWSSMLVEAGVTAGGLSAAMSEESMKSLKYCLQWLQYATAHIEHQITILRDLIVKLNHGELDLTSPAAQNLSNIKSDVVDTIRNVVDVVGKYAGGALPEPARASVKAFILSLPARWATVNRASSAVDSRQGAFGSSPASPSFSSAHMSQTGNASSPSALDGRSNSINTIARQQAAATAVAANRVLTLAVESLDILRSVTVVFGESLDRADLWVERLRVLGLQRKRAHEQAAAEEAAARIDAGMGGALARGPSHWESARGMQYSGSQSPGAESNMSIGTTASSKRRRVKRRGTLRHSASPGPGGEVEGDLSDEGSSTETENAKFSAPSLGRSQSATNHPVSAVSGVHHHFQHPHGSSISHRRGKGKNGRYGISQTPPSGSTPLLQELTLRDRSESVGSRSASFGGKKTG